MRTHPASARRARALIALGLTLLLLPLAACGQAPPGDAQQPAAGSDIVALVNVTVLPMTGEQTLAGHTVLVQDGRIAAVGPADAVEVPAGARVVEGEGRFLMPGLAEMHGHIPGPQDPRYAEDVLFLYVSNGVTTVRGMAGHEYHLELRERVARGELVGPTIYAAGPALSPSSAPTAEAAERVVREQHAAGYDLLKVTEMSPDAYARMAATAHELGMPFAGHLPSGVGIPGALEHRQASIDHLDRYVEYLVRDGADLDGRDAGFFGSGLVDLVDTTRIAAAAAATREAGVWNVPTLSLVEHLASPEAPERMVEWPEMRYMPPRVLEGWVRAKHEFQARPDFQPPAAQRLVELRQQLLRALRDAEAPIALGSDAPQFFNVPGFSIHHEMEMMVAAGLTPYEVLLSGTRDPARLLGEPDAFGTVEVGRRADLILLEANPLDDIANVRRRVGVMVRGRWLLEQEIQDRLEAIAATVREAPAS